jgi:hypothetical protein
MPRVSTPRFVFWSEVLAYHGHHPHFGEVTGGEREVSCGASENVFYLAGRRGNCVKGYRTYYENAHESP